MQIGFTFLVPAYPGSPGEGPLNGCVCVCVFVGLDAGMHAVVWTKSGRLPPSVAASHRQAL